MFGDQNFFFFFKSSQNKNNQVTSHQTSPPLIRLLDCKPRWGLKSDLLDRDDFAGQFAKGQGSRYLDVKNGTEMSSVPMDRFW